MKIDNTIKVIKEVHPETVVLVEIGSFYHAYGKDANILAYLFDYQIKSLENSYSTCGMPKTALNKVLSKLEEDEVNYITVIRASNYEKDQEMNFKSKNKYNEIAEKAYKYITKKNRINTIHNYLMENINSPDIKIKLRAIEDTLFENRET